MLGLFNKSFLTSTFGSGKWLTIKTTSSNEGWLARTSCPGRPSFSKPLKRTLNTPDHCR
ncbi:Uncharacterised protein [Mycobacteroides abscessus subsp. massiliense]|nr:Uncharacterised protein [Mycobacteroides abscessus subsp. massiliense]